jgi:undecaprenyl diphosphate synthase
MILMLAISYSGRRDITQACGALAEEARRNGLRPDDIDEALIAERLRTSVATGGELSYPDLVIRTGGELRLSNFLLWQSAFAELSSRASCGLISGTTSTSERWAPTRAENAASARGNSHI